MWLYKAGTKSVIRDAETFDIVRVFEVGYLEMQYEQVGTAMEDVCPVHRFVVVEEYSSAHDARKAVNYLNGGNDTVEVSGVIYDKH